MRARNDRFAIGLDSADEIEAYAKQRKANERCCSSLRHWQALAACALTLCIPLIFILRLDQFLDQQLKAEARRHSLEVYSGKDVRDAGAPLLHSLRSRPGADDFSDARGEIRKLAMGGFDFDVAFTRAGFMRGGNLHKCKQWGFVFTGDVAVIMPDPNTPGNEVLYRYNARELFDVPADTAHIFRFDHDTVMAEWWDCPYHAYNYAPYRRRVERNNREQLQQISKAQEQAKNRDTSKRSEKMV